MKLSFDEEHRHAMNELGRHSCVFFNELFVWNTLHFKNKY